MASAVWLTWAIFSKQFTDYDDVTLVGPKSGLALPEGADVKLRGMTVGVVRDVRVEKHHVVMTLGMDPQLIERIPRDVRAEIIPKTLFGEKYISLVPTSSGQSGRLRAGDTIGNAVVPIEFEKFFNDVYPLLTAVPPEKVGYTLTALANTLEGRGGSLGQTLEESNDYLKKFDPESQRAIDDLVQLGQVSSAYSGQMSNFGQVLRNSAKLSRTVTDRDSESADLFKESTHLGDVLYDFVAAAGDDAVATADHSVKPLQVGAEYATMFPCWFKAENKLVEVVNQVFANGTFHGAMSIANPQPTRYGLQSDPRPEHPIMPTEAAIDSVGLSQPEVHGYKPNPSNTANPYPAGLGTVCDELYDAASGNPRTAAQGTLPIPPEVWKLFGVRSSHNGKLGTDAAYNRPATPAADWIALLMGPALW